MGDASKRIMERGKHCHVFETVKPEVEWDISTTL